MWFLLIIAWIIGIIVPFATDHVIWGIAAILLPPLAIVIGGFWMLVIGFALVANLIA